MVIDVDLPQPATKKPKEMLSLDFREGKAYVKINFSSLAIMQECWRKCHYSLVRGLRSNVEAPATVFGSAIHKALEVFYAAPREDRKLPRDFRKQMDLLSFNPDIVKDDALVYQATKAFIKKAEPCKNIPPGVKRSIENGVWLLRHYFEKYIDDPFTTYIDDEGPFVERRLSHKILDADDLQIELFGTIDLIVKNEQSGNIIVCDHKTTSVLGSQFYNRLKPNYQYTTYLYLVNEVLGLDTNSFLVNALQVKDIPKTARGTGPQFVRQVTTRDAADFADLLQAIEVSVRTFLGNKNMDTWLMHSPGPCGNFGGCQFLDVCSSHHNIRENIITAKYGGNA